MRLTGPSRPFLFAAARIFSQLPALIRTLVGRRNMEDDELSDFDKGQVVVARELGLSVSKTARTVGCSRAAVVKAYRQWYEEGLRLRAGRPRLFDPKALDDDSGSESEEPTEGEKMAEQEPEAAAGERTEEGEKPGESSADPTEEGGKPGEELC